MAEALTRFLVELEQPPLTLTDVEALASGSRCAADAERADGRAVRFLRVIYAPEDGRCYLLYEGPSAASVLRALERGRTPGTVREALVAGMPGDRRTDLPPEES